MAALLELADRVAADGPVVVTAADVAEVVADARGMTHAPEVWPTVEVALRWLQARAAARMSRMVLAGVPICARVEAVRYRAAQIALTAGRVTDPLE